MKIAFASQHYSLFLLVSLLIWPLSSLAISEVELNHLINNANQAYVYCDKAHSKMADVIAEISKFDSDKNSPIWQLHDHIQGGFSIGREEAIVDALAWAASFLDKNYNKLNRNQFEQIRSDIDSVMNEIANDQLAVDMDSLINNRASGDSFQVRKPTTFHETVKFKDKASFKDFVNFHDNAHFQKDVTVKHDLTVDQDLTVKRDLTVNQDLTVNRDLAVEGDLTVDGVLTADSEFVNCNLTVGCNILMKNSISPSFGNIMKNGVSFIHNFGDDNTFVGSNAGNFSMAGSDNSAFGFNAMNSNSSGSSNTACGSFALFENTQGDSNTAIGSSSLSNNTTGSGNTALGQVALISNITGSGNTAGGVGSLASNANGSNNTAFGLGALSGSTSGSNNIALGESAGSNLLTGNNNIYIENAGVAAESGVIKIGTSATHTAAFMQGIYTTAIVGVPVEVNIAGQLGVAPSSEQFKKNVRNMGVNSADIYKLRPVTFEYNSNEQNTIQYGLIAEEVANIYPSLVVHDKEGNPYSVRYQMLPALLLNEVQKQQATIQDLVDRVARLEENAPAA